ncbi:MAG: CstA-like transporter-associated (seleno)protein [Gammaproteobacteria bacterium]
MRFSLKTAISWFVTVWQRFNGETAYQRYLAHWAVHHVEADTQPLNRKAFFADETRRKWDGIRRCC